MCVVVVRNEGWCLLLMSMMLLCGWCVCLMFDMSVHGELTMCVYMYVGIVGRVC